LGIQVDPKRAVPRDEQDKTEKIFVGGIPQEITEADFHEFFSQFGRVVDANLMMDRNTGRPRGFGFITFENKDGVQKALAVRNLELGGKMVRQ
jgi:RNA-binding protein Musashi